MRKRLVSALILFSTVLSFNPANAILAASAIPPVFDKLLDTAALANPAMIVIDQQTGEVVYERIADSPRKPASVMKLLSAAATIEYLDLTSRFSTNVSLGQDERTLVIRGSLDPWLSTAAIAAKKMHRTSIPNIGLSSIKALKAANAGSLKHVKVLYAGLYASDIANLKKFWKKSNFKPYFQKISLEEAQNNGVTPILESTSPTVQQILTFTMLNSDNVLSERLARLASIAAGHPNDVSGVTITFETLLATLNIDATSLVVADASGLSKKNKVTARMIGQLLLNLRKDSKFSSIYTDLPVSGVSGTLKDRFIETAPNAVGLIHAKTGTLNGTVTLAGYVQSAEREYIFVTLADNIPKGYTATNKARSAIDRILGRIAAPNISAEISEAQKLP